MTRSAASSSRQGGRPDELGAGARLAARASAASSSTSWSSATAGSRPGLPDGVRGRRAARGRRHPGRPQRRRRRTSRGELLFFLDDDASLVERRRARAASARAVRRRPGARAAPAARRAARAAARCSRDWVPRLRVGDRARPSDVDGRVGGRGRRCRGAVFEQVGGWPAEFRFVHEGVDLAWRVHGRRLSRALRGRHRRAAPVAGAVPPPPRATRPTTARATGSGSRAATCRCRSACSTS